MQEKYGASGIKQMSLMILKTVDEMEKNLEEIIKNLNIYKSNIKDNISDDAESLVRRIRDQIDEIRKDYEYRADNSNAAADEIRQLEEGGLEAL